MSTTFTRGSSFCQSTSPLPSLLLPPAPAENTPENEMKRKMSTGLANWAKMFSSIKVALLDYLASADNMPLQDPEDAALILTSQMPSEWKHEAVLVYLRTLEGAVGAELMERLIESAKAVQLNGASLVADGIVQLLPNPEDQSALELPLRQLRWLQCTRGATAVQEEAPAPSYEDAGSVYILSAVADSTVAILLSSAVSTLGAVEVNQPDHQLGRPEVALAIAQASVVIVLLSPAAVLDTKLLQEVMYSVELKKQLLPVSIAPGFGEMMPGSLKMCLRRYLMLLHILLIHKFICLAAETRKQALLVRSDEVNQSADPNLRTSAAKLLQTPRLSGRETTANSAKKSVYICYSRKDSADVLPVWRDLEAEGIDCWIDVLQRKTKATNWREETSSAIEGCNAMMDATRQFMFQVCMVSANSVGSSFCQEECQLAKDSDKPLVYVSFEETCPGGPAGAAASIVITSDNSRDSSVLQLVTELRYLLATNMNAGASGGSEQEQEQTVSLIFGAVSGSRWDELQTSLPKLCIPEVKCIVGGSEFTGVEKLLEQIKLALCVENFALRVTNIDRQGGNKSNPQLQVIWELRMEAAEGQQGCELCGAAVAFDGISTCVFNNSKLSQLRLHKRQQSNSSENQTASQTMTRTPSNTAVGRLEWVKGNLLGSGSFGSVYAALVVGSNELLAVKEIRLVGTSEADKKFAQELWDEIRIISSLGTHPNIVKYHTAQIDKDDAQQETLLIFLEHVGGGSLASMIAKFGRLPEDTVPKYTRQILSGVEFLHSSGVAHRDIKGANILVGLDGTLKLTDFGQSKTDCGGDGFTTMVGTPFWMAPEVVRGEGYGRPADIWSVACTVVEMCTGNPPWSQLSNAFAVMFKIGHSKEPPDITGCKLSEAGNEFLRACFECDPEKRASSSVLLSDFSFICGSPHSP